MSGPQTGRGRAAARAWTLVDNGARPLTVNAVAKLHRQQWATHTRQVRETWAWLAIAAQVPHLERARVTVTPLHRDRRSPQDVAACAPEAKAAIDGLVDAGVLDDDNSEFLVELAFRPPDVCGLDGLRLTIEEAP